ncbi:hypothetical protein FRIG_15725, partial [Frigoribacterium faeni]|uniref:hypothetical protein n=1 Tax=Frigoribacterium faeni TaxID=145483 RepID=UPI001FABEDE0
MRSGRGRGVQGAHRAGRHGRRAGADDQDHRDGDDTGLQGEGGPARDGACLLYTSPSPRDGKPDL